MVGMPLADYYYDGGGGGDVVVVMVVVGVAVGEGQGWGQYHDCGDVGHHPVPVLVPRQPDY